ncbi:hypothetical protein KIN20_031426 [Parelaphostrongylus tenuis]|uniref:Homeobox domain-containing protein n=1 Tax=Parelaphostrongylus tenuis TaxID=148309 RepID=A0AAD5WH90_PARTN|nr:hypothetical protein KIN20_031426 [Parelaphostrongylus tenuis]
MLILGPTNNTHRRNDQPITDNNYNMYVIEETALMACIAMLTVHDVIYVANWFGNRRIRTKKTQRQLLSNPDQNAQYLQNRGHVSLNDKEYMPNNQGPSVCQSVAGYKYIP